MDSKFLNLEGVSSLINLVKQEIEDSKRYTKEEIISLLKNKLDKLTIDEVPTYNSNNLISSKGVYNALTTKLDKRSVPTKTSELVNDSNYITADQVPNPDLSSKLDVIIDLNNIRTGALLGATAVLTETDPTVPSHVKNITLQDVTDWDNKLYCPIIEDTRNGDSTAIYGNAPFTTLKDGQIILLHLKYLTKTDATLNLTLSGGTTTGAIDIKTRSPKSSTMLLKIDNNYCKYVSGLYVPMLYNSALNCWICLSPADMNNTNNPIIADTRNSQTAIITGIAPFNSLKDGQMVRIRISQYTADNTLLNLTLSNGTTTGAKYIKGVYSGGSRVVGNNDFAPKSILECSWNQSDDMWWLTSMIDTNTKYVVMQASELENGQANTARAVSSAFLRDNFYLKSEVNSICPIIEDTRTSAVNGVTGNAPFSSLIDGQRIILHVNKDMANDPRLTLTLSDNTTTNAISIYYSTKGVVNQTGNVLIKTGSYIELIYDHTNTRWVAVGQMDTCNTYSAISLSDLTTGTSLNSRLVSAKLLRDNFYLKSETCPKLTLEDNPYVIVDIVIDYNSGGITESSLTNGLDTYCDDWYNDDVNAAAFLTICDDLTAHTISSVKMRKNMAEALTTIMVNIDIYNGDGGGLCENYRWLLDSSKYIDLGQVDNVTTKLPTNDTTINGYLVSITGASSGFSGNLEELMDTMGVSAVDRPYIRALVNGQVANSGAAATYPMTTSAKTAFDNLSSWKDFYDEIINYVTGITTGSWIEEEPLYSRTDEFLFTFTCGASWSTDPTLPNNVVMADDRDWSEAAEGVKFQCSIQDDICSYLTITPSN